MASDTTPQATTSQDTAAAASANRISRSPVSTQSPVAYPTTMTQAIGGTIALEIDGKSLRVPHGTTILEAARQIGARVPTLCYHEDLCIAGICRWS